MSHVLNMSPAKQGGFIDRPSGWASMSSNSPEFMAIYEFVKERQRQLQSVADTGKSPVDLDVSKLLNEHIPMDHWKKLARVYLHIETLEDFKDTPRFVTHSGEVLNSSKEFAKFYEVK